MISRYRHGLATLGLLAALVAMPTALHASDWPQLQRDAARSGYSPDSVGVPDGGQCVVKWRWHPDRETSIAGRVQPVVAGGVLCVGFYDGKMYAINTSDGSVKWSYQAGGAILHTAAMDSTKVYFGCQDGKLYAVNLSNGSLAWSYDTGKVIYAAPCLDSGNGRIYIGNGAGTLYAISTGGTKLWEYASGRPIQTTAAYANGTVYCGNEGMYAFAVSASSGQESWKVRLKGQSMASYWPVVMPSQNVVFYRTQPVNVFHGILGEGDTVLGGDSGSSNLGDGTTQEFSTERQNIRNHLSSNPDSKTFWALDTSNGSEKYLAPVLYTAGEACTPVPPIYDAATGRAWYICRSRYARYDTDSIVRRFGCEPAKFNASTGDYTLFATLATRGTGIHCIGDETSILSADAWGVLVSARGTLGYIRHSPEGAVHVVSSQTDTDYNSPWQPKAYTSGSGYPDWSVEAGGGQGGGQCGAAIVADNSIYWIARWGLIVRVDRQ